MATLDGDEQPLTTGVLAEEVPLPDDPWEHGSDPWRRSPDMHSGGMNAATGTPPPGLAMEMKSSVVLVNAPVLSYLKVAVDVELEYLLVPQYLKVPAPFLAMEYVMELGCPPAVEDSSRWECRVGGSRKGGGPPDPDDDGDDEGGSTSRDETRSSAAATSEIRSMLRRKHHRDGNDSRPKSSLGSVKIEEYYGDRSRYIKWKRAIEAQQHLYALNEGELSMLIYLSTRKEARDVVEQHPIHCYTGSGGLQLLWKVMDEAFGESEAELFERADKELERYPDSRISDKAWGQKLLQKASLSRRERLDCYHAAGASYDSLEIEKALRVRCGRIHEDEKKVSHPRERPSESYRSPGTSNYNKKKVFVRRRVNHTHLEQGADENEDFDEMEPIEEEALDETMEPEDSMEEAISSAEEVDEEELKEVFAAGWKAKQKTAEDPLHQKRSGGGNEARVNGANISPLWWEELVVEDEQKFQPDERMSRTKRERRNEEDDRGDLVEEPAPFTYDMPKERMRSALGGGSRSSRSEEGNIKLSPRSLMTTLPEMSKDEKKKLKEALQRDEEAEAWRSMERHRLLTEEMDQESRHGVGGYHHAPMRGVSRGQDDQRPIIPKAKPLLQPPKGDKPRPVKERELQELFREAWTANGDGHQARCKVCDLKNVIYFSTRHGVLMVSNEDEDEERVRKMIHVPPSPAPSNIRVKVKYVRGCVEFQDVSFEEIGVHDLHCRITKDLDGNVIEDSGCRNAVGGLWWHNAFQNYLRERKLPFERLEEREVYRFGAGEPVVSTVAYIYPVGIHGKPDVVRISVVEKEAIACPGLIGPSELQRWNAVFKFATKEMQLQDVVKPMKLTSTRHPGIDLTDAPELLLQRFWHSEEGQNRRRKLVYEPQSLAFDALEQPGSTSRLEAQAEDEEAEESESLTDDLSEPTEESSHEQGVEIVSDTCEDDEDIRREARERENEIYWTASSKKTMNKGLKRKLGHCVKEIKEGFQHEKTKSFERTPKKELKKAPDKARRSRPFSVLEVFTWTCAISLVAASRGWTAYEPVTLPGWDLMKDSDYKMALEYIDPVSPDLLVIAWPCTKWSRLQTMGRKSVLQLARLVTERKKQRKLLRFTRDAALRQRRRRGRALGENPATSLAWKEPLIVEAFDGLAHEVTDMCCYGLKVPGKGALRKRTRLAGHKGVMKYCVKKCCCRKPHVPVLGSAKIGGRWRSVSDFAGGYTKFAEAVIRGAEEDLENDEGEAEVFVEGGVPEETWRPEDEAEEEDRSEAEEHQDEDGDVVMGEDAEKIRKGSVKWKVRALHQRLGHPTKATLRRMLVLSGAPKEYHMAVLLRSRAAAHVARKFHRHWCSLYGCPEDVILDQGGEFDGAFVAWLEGHGIHSKVSGARSAWQHGFAERHGAVLGTMCTSLIWQYQARGATQVKDCLCAAVQAKNMTLTRKGYTPYQMVFGRSPLFPDLLEEDTAGNMALRDSLTMEGEVSRAAEMRAAARAVLLRQDVQQKLKRALTRIPRGEDREYDPGEKVFFYVPTPKTARFRRGGGFWRGPALIIMRESSQRYYISWRGRCLLVSAPNLRPASELEALDHEERMEEVRALEEHLEKKVRIKLNLTKKNLRSQRSLGCLKKESSGECRKEVEAKVKLLKQPGRSNEEQKKDVEEKNEELRKQLDIFMRQPREEEFTEDVRRNLQDDVPIQFKRKRQEDVDLMDEDGLRKRIRKEVLNYTMLASTPRRNGRRSNEWASRAEVKKLASLLDLPIVNARYHIEPRKRFQKPPSGSYGGRITVMLQEQAGTGMICQETAEDMRLRPRRRSAAEWKGMTLFLRKEKPMQKSTYVEMPDGVYEVMVTNYEDWKKLWISEDGNQAFCEAYLLLNKANGKELDPKHFDQGEKEKFEEADRKEWMSWIENKVVRRLSPEEIQKVDKRLIFKAPARIVRVNKGALDGILRAKSRMVIPGHLDPHLGEYKSDAPTTAWVAVQMAKCIATNRGWMASSFDVSTALWYLRATELLVEVGFKEIPMCRATYIWKKKDSSDVAAILCLHVDDGLLVAAKDTMDYLKKSINERFSIKEWQDLGEKPVTFLGVKTKYVGGVFYDDMSDYVANLQEAEVDASAEKDAVLQGASLSAYRRLIMQLRWPAHLVMPEFLYVTSAMAQKGTSACVADLVEGNKVLKTMKEAAKSGGAQITIRPLHGDVVFVSYFDASLGSSGGRAQQGEVHLMTTEEVFNKPSAANMLEFHSNKISRVVRSSLAAEGSAMASAGDRLLYNRALYDALCFGVLEFDPEWRNHLRTIGCLVTDAKGLHDHVLKTGGMASEKQAALDILMVKQLVENGALQLRWTPTWKQLADPLTKDMNGSLLEEFRRRTTICLIQTAEDAVEEERRAGIRRAQRERRKV
eukprot:symbB.v1.2.022474.t1/scaffold1996.1/size93170/9